MMKYMARRPENNYFMILNVETVSQNSTFRTKATHSYVKRVLTWYGASRYEMFTCGTCRATHRGYGEGYDNTFDAEL
jgi:hypothetical protein